MMSRPFGCFVLALVLLLPVVQSRATPDEEKEIQELYRRGLGGDAGAVDLCIAKLERVLQTEPANQLARVYLGSAYTLRSRDLGFGPKKLQTLKQGLATMDEAVAGAPEQPKIRLARALTTAALPGIFGRGRESLQDFALLAEQAQRSRAKFERGDLQIIFYEAGRNAQRDGDRQRASEWWQTARVYPNDPKLAAKIDAALAQLR